jgi:hypothetical protein
MTMDSSSESPAEGSVAGVGLAPVPGLLHQSPLNYVANVTYRDSAAVPEGDAP